MSECNFRNYGAWWYCSPEGEFLKEGERPFQLEMRAISRSLRKGYEIIKNKSIEDMAYSIKNQAKSGMTDLVENVGLSLERFSKAWWHSKLSTTTKYNPIFERDAEAIHLLFMLKIHLK